MFYRSYINAEFAEYLSRYFKGITILKDKLRKILVSFELAQAFSNLSCRFTIDVEFFEEQVLTEKEKRVANKYLYNSQSQTGSQFVSFIYQSNKANQIDIKVIESFIIHYQFAKTLFEDFIRAIIPENCNLEIVPLETHPFFIYTDHFIRHLTYAKTNAVSFDKEYFQITQREFDFDCFYHDELMKAAQIYPDIERINSISDKDIHKAQGADIGDLRRYVLEEKIPFNKSSYDNVIGEIQIDMKELKSKILSYKPQRFTKINPGIILQLLEQKTSQINLQKDILITLGKLQELRLVIIFLLQGICGEKILMK